MTPFFKQIESTQCTIITSVTLILSLLYMALVWFVYQADKVIQHQSQELMNAKHIADEANLAKTQFVSVVAHELKTPLTAIQGYTGLLEEMTITNEQQAKFLKIIDQNIDRMRILASDLSDISRIETGNLKLEITSINLVKILTEVVESLTPTIQEKEQTITIHLRDNLPTVKGDHDRRLQIFINLISNAHKYTLDGGHIEISAEEQVNTLKTSIKDSGIGIKKEEQAKIFQRFFRSEDEQARKITGTGLGLNITYTLVKMPGGTIGFESQYGHGTTFYVGLPLA